MSKFSTFVFAMMAMLAVSCNTNMFNEDDYKVIVEEEQPVKNIDKSHTWELTTTYYMTADIPAKVGNDCWLQILSGNPTANESATILGEYPVTAGEKKYFAFTAPSALSKFYAALVDKDDTYTVSTFNSSQNTVSFAQPLATKKIDNRLIGLQAFTYCFEDEMPEPGDYDYNDVVLRISQERTAVNQITLNVTVAAVGSLKQLAGAMRLVNYKFDEIESITTTDNETFDDGYKKSTIPFIDSNDLLMEGRNKEAVINLFEDAHWATGAAYYAKEGYIPRYKYNVSKTTSSEHDMMSPHTISYIITFKNPILLDYFTLDQIDPFIILEYFGAFMEEHAVYKYKSETILYEYVQPSIASILPWALVVPFSSFRYPLDNVNIGFYKDDALFGAYMTVGHSFGEWAASHQKSLDWYEYPTSNMVY